MSAPSSTAQVAPAEPAESGISPSLVTALLVAVLACEFVLLILGAKQKAIVWDELYTFHISSLRPFSLMWKAIQSGADGMTPAYYASVVLARSLPGDIRILLRLPSIVGYLLALVGVYWFVRKRFPPLAALSAVLILSLLPYREFAIEARAYALLVGSLAVAAALWQRADEKWWATPLLAFFLALGVSMHYLAVVALLGFGMAELAVLWSSRRLRWGVWIAFLFALAPFLLTLPLSLHLKAVQGTHYWAKTSWGSALLTYGHIFAVNDNLANAGAGLFLLTVAAIVWQLRHNPRKALSNSGFALPEILLIAGFLLLPVVLIALAKVAGSVYTDRYAWPAILALVFGFIFLTGDVWTKPVAIRLLAALLIVFVLQAGQGFRNGLRNQPNNRADRWSHLTKFSNADPTLPVALDSVDLYLEMTYYPAPELRKRIVRVVSPEAAVRLAGNDTSEMIHIRLAPFLHWRVEDSAGFLAANKKFLVQSDRNTDSWFVPYLIEKNYHLTLLWGDNSTSIFLVEA